MNEEVMFRPDILGKYDSGLAELIWESIQASPRSLRVGLRQNITIMGGGGNIPGLEERLSNELQEIAHRENFGPKCKFTICNPPERVLSAWIGANILSSLSNYQNWWITKNQYEETGQSVIHRMNYQFQ